jgi:uncharacterized protein (DUF58 family)
MTAGVDEGAWLSQEQLRSRRPWYLVALALLLASAVVHQPLVFVAGLLALAVGAIPELWYRLCFVGLVYQRQLSERRVFFGETVTLRLGVENRKLLLLPWLEVEDEFPEPLTLQGGRLTPHFKPRRMLLMNTFSLSWYQRVTRRYQVRCAARGVFTLGPLTMRSGDPFGILTREQRLEQEDTLLVYPPILPIERFGLPSRHPFGEQRAPRRLLEDPTRVIGVRDWQPEDDLRRVHWKASARAMSLQSKVYEPTTTYALALFVNVNTYANPVLGVHPALLELVMTAAASVAAWASEQGYAFGLFSNGVQALMDVNDPLPADTENRIIEGRLAMRVRLRPSSRPEQLPRVLEALARLIPYFGSSLEEILAAEQPSLPVGTTMVLVSAAAAITPTLATAALQARARGYAVVFLLSGDAPVEAPGVPIYRLGTEEVWHEIVAEATQQESPQPDEAGWHFVLA